MGTQIHSSAIIEKGAIIGEGSNIGAYSIIKSGVKIGKNNIIHSHVVIEGDTIIGDDNMIFPFAVIGSMPQVISWQGGKSKIVIGNNNKIREHVTIQPGLEEFGGVTKIGNGNFFMMSSHIGHDCIIGDHNRFTNYSALSGHVKVDNHVICSGLSGIHQFIHLGEHCFISGGSMVTMDVPPYCMVHGNRATLVQINSLGLSRSGFSNEDITKLKTIFRKLFFKSNNEKFTDNLENLEQEYSGFEPATKLFNFIKSSKRGICQYKE